jgi:hypothetical protein
MSDLGSRKRCPDCGLVKPIDQFGRNRRMADGLARYCKACFRHRSKTSYRKRMAEQGKQVRERPFVPDGSKYCPQCAEIKPISAFGRNRANSSGLADYCKPCHNRVMAEIKARIQGSERNYLLKRRYGLTEDEVASLRDRQGSRCLICLRRRDLHVDHDHASGDFRGLLCFRCNGGLGQFRDDTDVMRRAVDYLEGSPGRSDDSRSSGPKRAPRGERRSNRHYHLTRRYRIGADDVERLVEQQGGLCLVCRKAPPTAVDHDHSTGAVRGILCGDCNTGMGQLGDDPWILRRAIEYLTGGLLGLRRAGDGEFEVAVVRPRRPERTTDPRWDIGQIGGYDYAVLYALANEDSGEPWEIDTGVAESDPYGPAEPPEYVLS